MSCKHDLSWYDLVPVVSFLGLGGRCRYCKVRLSWQYPVVEMVNMLGWVGVWRMAGWGREIVGLGALGYEGWGLLMSLCAMVVWSVLVVMSVIDMKHLLLPDGTDWILVVIGVVASVVGSVGLVERVVSGAIAYGVFGLLHWSTRGRGLGWGDVKLAGAMGMVVGWDIGLVVGLGFVLGSGIGLVMLATGLAKLGKAVPFGPFLVLGFLATLLWGHEIMDWYWGLMGV